MIASKAKGIDQDGPGDSKRLPPAGRAELRALLLPRKPSTVAKHIRLWRRLLAHWEAIAVRHCKRVIVSQDVMTSRSMMLQARSVGRRALATALGALSRASRALGCSEDSSSCVAIYSLAPKHGLGGAQGRAVAAPIL